MTRNELFQYITENNLKEDVKKAFKKAYNSVSTEELNKFVENQINFNKEKEQHKVTGHPSLSRNECFDAIKTLHYEANIKALYGKPYNSVSTDKLNEFIKNELIEKGNIKEEKHIEACINEASVVKDECINDIDKFVDIKARNVLKALCTILNQKDLLKLLN